ncbi:hypothetical protein [Aquimarina sp. RZ0]|uniref:hypothetical protein n=1 Tax=Aquimarina sp. RZ0 TaxID=2607730 RepID=UPI0011F3FB7A|nr:hypothetical protein [Aquimarina sp. RZ0]KAA1247531.1 hypothetical protein F0000_03485 [Aquimarina sp. RZ0]
MKTKFLINPLLLLALLFISCSTDDDTPNNNNIDMNEIVIPSDQISSIDKQLLSQIKKAGILFDADEIWTGFNLTETPMYLVHKNKEGKVDRGIIINPQSAISNALEIDEENNNGLEVYRYDDEILRAFQLITSDTGNGLYDFNFKIDNQNYYLQIYSDDEVIAGEELAIYPGGFFDPDTITIGAIDFILHENFHTYQDSWNPKRTSIKNIEQHQKSSISKEILELRTLTHQIFKDFPNGAISRTVLEEKLKQYVAIRSKESELDSSIKYAYDLSETDEGSARYIERMAVRALFPKRSNESFIPGSVLDNDYGITNQEILTLVFDSVLLYEIGASVCLAISTIDREALDDINTDKTLFEVAKNLFNMSETELAQQLQNAKNSVDWNAIQTKVSVWQTLN